MWTRTVAIRRDREPTIATTMTDLFRAYWPAVYGYLVRHTRDRALAEELAQETFARATAAFLGWRGESPAAWLFAIARNVTIDHYRRHRPTAPLDSLDDAQLADQDPSSWPGTEVELRDLLSRLPRPRRRLLELVYLDGLTHGEVALLTGSTPGAVRTAVWRAREDLRALLEEDSSDQ